MPVKNVPATRRKKKQPSHAGNGLPMPAHDRLAVQKTYKLYINGSFVRSESGRYQKLEDKKGKHLCNLCRASRKDVRNAVTAARKAQSGWSSRTAYLRGQILYRLAENLESRRLQFTGLMTWCGMTPADAAAEFSLAVDRLVYYAGWCDKYAQLFSSVNPVSAPYFNFSYPEPTGVVGLIAPENQGLLALLSMLAPAVAGGNTVVMVAGSPFGPVLADLAEVIHGSDVPAGVINLLTGVYKEIIPPLASHMDVNAVAFSCSGGNERKEIETMASLNVKRPFFWEYTGGTDEGQQNPYRILDLQEIKTTWHPVGL